MRFPLSLTANMSSYIAGRRLRRVEKFPLVMMLEPLHACNLTCTGCGRIREYADTIKEKLTVEQCLAALDECGAPIVSICGGEPMIYPDLGRLVREILSRGKHIYLCTNGMFIRKRLREFKPTSRFFFNVHLDGLEKTHDLCVEREGVFRDAIDGIKAAKEAGFLVCTNTTIFKETDLNEIEDQCMSEVAEQAEYIFDTHLPNSNTYARSVFEQTPLGRTRFARKPTTDVIPALIDEMEERMNELTEAQ